MLNFDLFKKGQGIVSPPHLCMIFQEKCFSSYIPLIDHFSPTDCLYFLRYWSICEFQLVVNQVVTSQILKLTLSFESSRFTELAKCQDKNLNILRTKKAFNVK